MAVKRGSKQAPASKKPKKAQSRGSARTTKRQVAAPMSPKAITEAAKAAPSAAFQGPSLRFTPCVLPEDLTPKQITALRRFEETNNITMAATAAGICRDTFYDWQERYPAFKRGFLIVRASMLDAAKQCFAWAARVDPRSAIAYIEHEEPSGIGDSEDKKPQVYEFDTIPKPEKK